MLASARIEERALPVFDYAWSFLPGTSQEMALKTPAHHIFYHGTRGPGKTDCQLARFAKHVGEGYGSHWVGVIFDRKYKNLDDLVKKSKRMFRKAFGNRAKFLESKSDYKWVWDTGEELLFRAFEKEDDYWNYHGQEFPFIGWNELCKYPSSAAYDSMMSCNRSSWTQEKDSPVDEDGEYLVPPIPLIIFSTTNPYGPGHTWVKERFIDACPPGRVHKIVTKVFHPGLKQDVEITKYQVAIFGSYKENPYLPPEYIAELEGIKDENKRKAWLEGDWDIVAGGALSDLWKRTIHVKPRFIVPPTWRVDRAMDWGSSHPCSIGWFAEANGEEAELPDGTVFCPPPGTIIQIAELYLAESIGKNVGLRMAAKKVAEKIIEIEVRLMEEGWISDQPWPGPADNQIRNVIEADTDTIEKMFADKGVRWQESDKAPGSRKNGLELFRGRLEAALEGSEEPGWYCTENCLASIATLPTLPRDDDDPDDVDTDAIDHPYDMNRYRILKGANRTAKHVKVEWG
ncbi:large terminase [Sphingomonas phage Kimi]|nr:large terminase [Sphingomonas phage Kimi]